MSESVISMNSANNKIYSRRCLAHFLKEKRNVAGLLQKQVAIELGYSSAQFVSNWERAVATPPIETLDKLAQMYKVKPEDLFQITLAAKVEEFAEELKRRFFTALN